MSANAATLRAGVIPPIWLTCIRTKSMSWPVMSGRHSCGLLNSSPMASGVADWCRMVSNQPMSSGRQEIFQEEQPVRLDVLGELHGVNRMKTFMHVVQQLDVVTHLTADVVDHPEHGTAIGTGVEVVAVRRPGGRCISEALPPYPPIWTRT